MALKAANDNLKQKFLDQMSTRASEQFIEEMQFLGAVRMRDVEAAQRKIVEAVQTLSEQGLIQVGEEEDVVE